MASLWSILIPTGIESQGLFPIPGASMPGNYLNRCHLEQVRAIPQSGEARQNKTIVISRHVRLGRAGGETLRFLAGSVRAFPCSAPVNCESYLKNSRHLETYPAWPD